MSANSPIAVDTAMMFIEAVQQILAKAPKAKNLSNSVNIAEDILEATQLLFVSKSFEQKSYSYKMPELYKCVEALRPRFDNPTEDRKKVVNVLEKFLKAHTRASFKKIDEKSKKVLEMYLRDEKFYLKLNDFAKSKKVLASKELENLISIQTLLHAYVETKTCPQSMWLFRVTSPTEMSILSKETTSSFEIANNIGGTIDPAIPMKSLKESQKGKTKMCCLMCIYVPKGYPYLYLPALLEKTKKTDEAKEVFIPAGHYSLLNKTTMSVPTKSGATVELYVVCPQRCFSPFVTTPDTIWGAPAN